MSSPETPPPYGPQLASGTEFLVSLEARLGPGREGYAVRDPASTTCAGAIKTAADFRNRIYLEAWNRGRSRAENFNAFRAQHYQRRQIFVYTARPVA